MFNESMSVVRVSLEWLLADIINYFKLLDLAWLGLSQVGKMHIVCAILRNALTVFILTQHVLSLDLSHQH